MRKEKQLLVDEIKDKIDNSSAFILASYKKLPANHSANFRDELVKTESHLGVVQKRVFFQALKQASITLSLPKIEGHLAVVFIKTDPVQTAKAIYKYSEDNEEVLTVLGGHFEGKTYQPQDVKQLSKLPSLDQLRAEFLGLLVAPMSETLGTIEALLTSMIYLLENKSEEKS